APDRLIVLRPPSSARQRDLRLRPELASRRSPLPEGGARPSDRVTFAWSIGEGDMAASVVVNADGKHELSGELPRSQLYNKDLAPTPAALRNWGLYSFLAFWVGCSVVIPSWSLANIGLVFGFDPATSIFVVVLGNAIVTVPSLLNSHVGATYGIPFPVFVRPSLGTWGANVRAMRPRIAPWRWY